MIAREEFVVGEERLGVGEVVGGLEGLEGEVVAEQGEEDELERRREASVDGDMRLGIAIFAIAVIRGGEESSAEMCCLW